MEKQRAMANAVSGIADRFLEEAACREQASSKRIPFRPLFAAAACLVLVVGLSFLRPKPLKLAVNGENILAGSVTWTQSQEPQLLRAEQTLDVPLVLEPGRGGSVRLTADGFSYLELAGQEQDMLELTERTELIWHLRIGRSESFSLTVNQGGKQYLLCAVPGEHGDVTIRRMEPKT